MFARREIINPLIRRLKDVFYNDMVELALLDEGINAENIDSSFNKLVENIIINILDSSKDTSDSIRLSDGTVINDENCPIMYRPFFKAVQNIKNSTPTPDLERKIETLAGMLMSTEAFQAMLPVLKQFVLEAKGITPAEKALRKLDETGITTDLIRETFYNEMVTQTLQAINNGFITRDHLEEQEPFIYFALSGLTLLEAIRQSMDCTGIELLGGKAVTNENCPMEIDPQTNFPKLIESILAVKELMKPLFAKTDVSDEEYKAIQYLCLSREEDMPDDLSSHLTSRATKCAAMINSMSVQISQSKVFQGMVQDVIELCLDTLPEKGSSASKAI
ncbi:hypothetical protein [Legionella spiritensis]|uniref:Uncharacterized protein n=1 Tax=Legionella spiritensis TaxID=452 RepID=A0A0W0YYU7_LEGSP|nr:hypothetical protein [Legionella spiritensis]KTD62039.1 hypothetical protein Lspi_1889 [Legionella spiritensis]SNV34569.1 Uncharacterised protein [Legionella spiritensis]